MLHKVQAVHLLLELGADPNSTQNWESLHWAVQDRNLAIVKILLTAGANPDTADPEHANATPLTRAAAANDTKCMEILLAGGCDVNKPGILGSTAITLVIERFPHCCEESMKVLLDNGADPTIGNTEGFRTRSSAIEVAARMASFPREEIFTDIFAVAEKMWKKNLRRLYQMKSIISRAISARLEERVLWLLQRFDPPPEQVAEIFSGHLVEVCLTGDHGGMAEALLYKTGSCPTSVITHKVMAAAIGADRRECVKKFLYSGVDPSIRIQDGFSVCSALMFAIEKSREVMAMGLIQAGCDINSGVTEKDTNFPVASALGETQAAAIFAKSRCPVAYAATRGLHTLVAALLTVGCDMHDVTQDMNSGVLSFHMITSTLLRVGVRNPLSLKDISRNTIRKNIRAPLLTNVVDLPLPGQIIDYLLLRDMPLCLI